MEYLKHAALKTLEQYGGDSRKAAAAVYDNGPDEIRDYLIKVGLKKLAKLERRRPK